MSTIPNKPGFRPPANTPMIPQLSATSKPSLRYWTTSALLAFAALTTPLFLQAQPNPEDLNPPRLAVTGAVDDPVQLTAFDLQSLPRVKLQAKNHDGTLVTYEGVNLWDVITRAKPRLGDKPRAAIARGALVVNASDNYQAVFALAELDPSFTTNQIILADHADGKPLTESEGPFQIIVPADKIHARWVRKVISLEVVVPDIKK